MKISKLLLNILPLLVLGGAMVYAAAPSGGYLPGVSNNPDCAPGDTDCFVQALSGADNLGNHTATQNLNMSGSVIVGANGSSTGIFIAPNGNIGIGTVTPSLGGTSANVARRYMTIVGENGPGVFQMSSSTGDTDGQLLGNFEWVDLQSTSPDKRVGYFNVLKSGTTAGNRGGYMAFGVRADNATAAIERMRITNMGELAIGSTTAIAKVDIKGSTSDALSGALSIRNSSNTRIFHVRNDGNVGIGTINPKSTLEVNGIIATGVQTVNAAATSITKSYVSLSSGDAILPRAQDNPGAIIFLRNVNNSGTINVTISAGGGQFFDASSTVGFSTYGMNGNTTGKSLMIVSDGSNWTVFRPAN